MAKRETMKVTVWLPISEHEHTFPCCEALTMLAEEFHGCSICWTSPFGDRIAVGMPLWHGRWSNGNGVDLDSHLLFTSHVDKSKLRWEALDVLERRVHAIYARWMRTFRKVYQQEIFVEAWDATRVEVDSRQKQMELQTVVDK